MNALAQVHSPSIRAMVPQTMPDVFNLAEAVHRSGLAPAGLNNPQAVAIAILHGLELGVPPMTALQRIAVINGRPTIWGDLAMALVRSSGAAESIKEEIVGEGDQCAAICTVKRRGEPEPIVGRFSVADAKRAGLWDERPKVRRRNKQSGETYEVANDAPWHRFPERMMKMRARAFALRDGFADVLGGLYLREEIEEDEIVEAEPARAMPKPPAPPKPNAAPALPAPEPQADSQSALDKLSNPEVREMVTNSPSAPSHVAKAPPKPPVPPQAPAPEQGRPAREERAPKPAAGPPRPPAPPAAGTELFDDFPGDKPMPDADVLTDLEGRFTMATTEEMLQRMWAFAEEDITALPMAQRQEAEALYDRHLARIQRR